MAAVSDPYATPSMVQGDPFLDIVSSFLSGTDFDKGNANGFCRVCHNRFSRTSAGLGGDTKTAFSLVDSGEALSRIDGRWKKSMHYGGFFNPVKRGWHP